eukprot:CAMPEP_0196583266 /NCGR_PEP_ID=MMETSP1081-20130531/42741_1 /TAXON_ID=36882 /ORGANISM="Pyramimonas amylifera, Strain CCMP720" /LENGTH=124 /DNA_ID=CAMNT_0041904093 /DNA_START=514 /DNA_END=888 /DNA_ORIENTATION=+
MEELYLGGYLPSTSQTGSFYPPVSSVNPTPTTPSGSVFNVLSLKTLVSLACEYVTMYENELNVKSQLGKDLLSLVKESESAGECDVKACLDVYTSSLLVEPMIDTRRLEEINTMLDNEFKTNSY